MIPVKKLDINKILEIDYVLGYNKSFIKNNALRTFKHCLSKLSKRIGVIELPKKNADYSFLFIRSLERPSYNDLWNQIISSCHFSKLELQYDWANATFLHGDIKLVGHSKWKRLFKALVMVLKYLRYVRALQRQDSISGYISTYFRLLVLLAEAEKIKKIPFKHLVVFADMQRLDNLLVQYFKNEKTTITLQHGLYVDYKSSRNVNTVNYEHVVSTYFLSWGYETKKLIEKYHSDCNVVVCGNPCVVGVRYTATADYFTVVLDQVIFSDHNQKMLDIAFEYAKNTGLKVNVKIHPLDTLDRYRADESLLVFDDYKKALFVIGHTSTMLFELMSMGVPAYKFRSEVPCNEINSKITFATLDELSQIRTQNIDFVTEGNYYISYSGDESKQRYQDFFGLVEKNKH